MVERIRQLVNADGKHLEHFKLPINVTITTVKFD